MKKGKILLTLMLTTLALTLLTTTTRAAYQSIPTGNGKQQYATVWITGIRQMEESNGGMGLNEKINTANGLATTESNGIDVHLQKNTEYGAVLLLGASDYGKQGQNTTTVSTSRYMNIGATSTSGTAINLATSTGNVTGVYELGYGNMATNQGNWEWTAGGGTDFLSNIAPRYRDIYETRTGKPGDATIEDGITLGNRWHGSSYADFATGSYGFKRGSNGAFSATSSASSNSRARAVVVSAVGL